jgi:hypothetical protein
MYGEAQRVQCSGLTARTPSYLVLNAQTPVRSEKKARPRLKLGIRLILTFLMRLSV